MTDSTTTPSDPAPAVHHVSVKPPVFSRDTATSWFQIIEAQLHLAKITNKTTRFYHAISALPPDVVKSVSPLVLDTKDFDILKAAVISEHEETKSELFDDFMNCNTFVGRPSAFLNSLVRKAEKLSIGPDLIRHKFIQALPQNVAPVVATQKTLSLPQLGSLADELVPLGGKPTFAVQRSPSPSTRDLAKGERPIFRRNRDDAMPSGVLPFAPGQSPQICRSHIYFADRARRCEPWCKWPTKANYATKPSSRPASPTPGNQ